MKKWIAYRIHSTDPRVRPGVDNYMYWYYTREGSSLSYTDPGNWTLRIGRAHVFECHEEEMQHWQLVKAKQGCAVSYREIHDDELFIERLRG